jgi:uncharacterized protein
MGAYGVLLANPLGALAFFFFIVTFVSLWLYKRVWVWLPLFGASFAFAYFGNVVTPLALVPTAILMFCHGMLSQKITGFWRLLIVMVAAIVSFGLLTHFIKGFNNIELLSTWKVSKDSVPIRLFANYDKPIAALFIIAFYLPLIQSKKEVKKIIVPTVLWGLFTMIIILGLAYYLEMIRFEFKLPAASLLWLILQIFFVVIPEEVFYRGFLQREIAKDLNNKVGGILALFTVSLLFALTHLLFVHEAKFFVAAFVSSLLYGGIYLITGAIESAIVIHLLVNIVHFFFFTYPMLQA